jgi:hypothetical protein
MTMSSLDNLEGDQRPAATPAPSPPETSSQFELKAERKFHFSVSVSQRFVGKVPGGFRVDLHFDRTSDDAKKNAEPTLTSPKVLSGNDWVAVSDDGVIDFDSRCTLQFGKAGTFVPVSARLRGRASVRDATAPTGPLFSDKDTAGVVMNAWVNGLQSGALLPLRLTVVFDIPREGFSEAENDVYDELRPLGRSLFIGYGHATFDGNQYGSVNYIEMDVFKLTGDQRAA